MIWLRGDLNLDALNGSFGHYAWDNDLVISTEVMAVVAHNMAIHRYEDLVYPGYYPWTFEGPGGGKTHEPVLCSHQEVMAVLCRLLYGDGE